MSSLTSQQINNSYQGLLKLADSTTGITSSLQSVQDGLGNDLPLKVKDSQIQGQNLFSFGYFVPDYEGPGLSTTSMLFPATSQNTLIGIPFYNAGLNSYSGFTYRVITASSTSDSATISFYSTQFISGLGLVPKDLILSGINLDTSSTGVKVASLPSDLSFSGTGSGIYFAVLKISNSGVTPTVRFASDTGIGFNVIVGMQLGLQFATDNLTMANPSKTSGANVFRGCAIYTGLVNYQTSFVNSDFSGGVANLTINSLGFALNVIK